MGCCTVCKVDIEGMLVITASDYYPSNRQEIVEELNIQLNINTLVLKYLHCVCT